MPSVIWSRHQRPHVLHPDCPVSQDTVQARIWVKMPTVTATAPRPQTDRVVAILEAACRVVVREGAHGLRMASVADEAGVSKALVHYYFSTRQELLRSAFAFSESRARPARRATRSPGSRPGAERLERALLVSIDADTPISEQRALWNEVWSSLRFDDELRPLVERWYRTWLDRVVRAARGGPGGRLGARRRSTPTGGRRAARGGRRRRRLDALPRAARPRRRARAPARLPAARARAPRDRRRSCSGPVWPAWPPRAISPRGGADVTVLEARDRVGGRSSSCASTTAGRSSSAARSSASSTPPTSALVEELGLTLEPSYTAVAGQTTYDLLEGVERADVVAVPRHEADRADYERVERLYGQLAATVDPDDPWSHPDAARLDGVSVGTWLRSVDALPGGRSAASRPGRSPSPTARSSARRCSPSSASRRPPREEGFYSDDRWESLQVAEGSAEVAERMAAELGGRIRLGAVVASRDVSASGCRVRLAGGEELAAEAVVCALPVGVLDGIPIDGVSAGAAASLRAQRMALAAKVVTVYPPLRLGGRRRQRARRGRAPPRLDVAAARGRALRARAAGAARATCSRRPRTTASGSSHDELERMYGPAARDTDAVHIRLWATDPFTRGYVTHWWPGDVLRVGPLHGTHDPPFYVCGSDQWVAGYMEGAVRTGRAAAAAALGARLTATVGATAPRRERLVAGPRAARAARRRAGGASPAAPSSNESPSRRSGSSP